LDDRERQKRPLHRPTQVVNVATGSGLNSKRARARNLRLALPILEVTLGTKEATLTCRNVVGMGGDGLRFARRGKDLPLNSATTNNGGIGAKEATNRDRFRNDVRNEIIGVVSKRMGSSSIEKDIKRFARRRETRDVALKGLSMTLKG
jgi:hypothetical protein